VHFGTPLAPPEKLSLPIGGAISFGFRYAFEVLKSAPITMGIAVAGGLAIGALVSWQVPHVPDPKSGLYPEILGAASVAFFFGLFAQLGIVQQAMRLTRPHFRYSPTSVLVSGLFNAVIGLVSNVAIYALIWPAFWLQTKTAWIVPAYLVAEPTPNIPDDALSKSWTLTNGAFWESWWFLTLLTLATALPIFVITLALGIGITAMNAAIFVTPLLLVLGYYAIAVYFLALMHFYDALIARYTAQLPLPA
jgi:hypothetical protein